ncbi:MAG: flagellar biosynthesis protein FlhB [Granulosicoccus sp.]|nr:flagellar biosynthesis protein FlhB [Granulosicoccus sp.]
MAENDSAQERTEPATPKRLADARAKGDVPRSKELNTVLMLLVSLVGFAALGSSGVQAYKQLTHRQWQISREQAFGDLSVLNGLYVPLIDALWISAPFLVLMFFTVFIGPLFMGGWVFSLSSLKFDLKKVNPISGIKKIFGLQGLVEMLKAVLKVILLVGVSIYLFGYFLEDFLSLGSMPINQSLKQAFKIIFLITLILVLALGLVALIDVPYQKWNYAKKLRMSFQEVKEENKEQQGNPEVKSKIRQLQQANANRKMLLDVPMADVVIINPTHYSIALKYDDDQVAPVLLAKGIDHMAIKIREVAVKHEVTIFSAPPLARALYSHSEIGETIPSELYLAVAQVLAYVLQVKEASFEDRARLVPPTDLPVPGHLINPRK